MFLNSNCELICKRRRDFILTITSYCSIVKRRLALRESALCLPVAPDAGELAAEGLPEEPRRRR